MGLNGSLISRSDAEVHLAAWPGYIDGLEDALNLLLEEQMKLERLETSLSEEYHRACIKAWEDERIRAANERHPQLRIWRERSPVADDRVPAALKSIRHIKQLEVNEPCCVYFLLKEEVVVVYVGQTFAFLARQRILQHLRDGTKSFDDVCYLEVDRPSLTEVERHFINKFQPVYDSPERNRSRLTL